jgi:ssDNA-binding Zn-finger/Zn-ribbon topoisomerase 1
MTITCPRCHEPNIRRSHSRLIEVLFRGIGLFPWRCNLCDCRFYRFRKTIS